MHISQNLYYSLLVFFFFFLVCVLLLTCVRKHIGVRTSQCRGIQFTDNDMKMLCKLTEIIKIYLFIYFCVFFVCVCASVCVRGTDACVRILYGLHLAKRATCAPRGNSTASLTKIIAAWSKREKKAAYASFSFVQVASWHP